MPLYPAKPFSITDGGTGASSAAAALTALGAAPSASPTFTGTPVLPTGTTGTTQTATDSSTKLATTAFVQAQFVPWTDWTPTISGYSANPTNTVYRYMQIEKLVIVLIRELTAGTSNNANHTYSLPVSPAATKTNMVWSAPAAIVDNTSTVTSGIAVIASAGTVLGIGLGPYATQNVLGGGNTASGGSKVTYCTLMYEVP